MQGALRTKGKDPDTAEVQLLKPALLDNGLRGDVSQRRLGRGEADSEYERFVLRQCQREEHGVVPHGVSAARRHIDLQRSLQTCSPIIAAFSAGG